MGFAHHFRPMDRRISAEGGGVRRLLTASSVEPATGVRGFGILGGDRKGAKASASPD
jgi:hypothetical protein